MFLTYDIVDIEKLDAICLPTIVVHEFSGWFLDPSMFYIKHSRPA